MLLKALLNKAYLYMTLYKLQAIHIIINLKKNIMNKTEVLQSVQAVSIFPNIPNTPIYMYLPIPVVAKLKIMTSKRHIPSLRLTYSPSQ